ncbi:MAG: sulfotransferase [Rubrivivax sp.]|nr:sulfotransferase [Rubrivivax sp.]
MKQTWPRDTNAGTRPPPAAAELRERLRGLNPAQADMMRKVMQLHAAGDRLMSAQWLLLAAREAPDHPEVRLWQALRHFDAREWAQSAEQLVAVVAARPDDFSAWAMLGSAQARSGDVGAAEHSLERAAALARSAEHWLKLSLECDEVGLYEGAMRAVQGHLRLQPASALGLLQRARVAKALGQSALAASDARALIASGREAARAWFTLVDLKTVALDEDERAQLARTAAAPGLPGGDRVLLDFALGKALEDAGDPAGALAALQRANAAVRAGTPWDGLAFARQRAALRDGAAGPSSQASAQGREVIFLVGLPRSGSTLVEQVLAAHSEVEGASELPYLQLVLQGESQRRGRPYAAWTLEASAADWTRLGQDYLRASAPWRRRRPIATDKLPDNWMWASAIRAMLPEARIIDCRRDALETCWSCYKQLFAPGLAAFSYDFDSLAQYWAACEQEGDRWAAHAPGHFRIQHYEALVAQPETQTRELLAFCGLPFEAGCLQSHTVERAIRTPSALQVRQPMLRTSTPAAGYGPLLDPLRAALQAAAQNNTA